VAAALTLLAVAEVPDIASAAFTPGRFVVTGAGLAGKRGTSVAVYAKPQAVGVWRCQVRKARVHRARAGVTLGATGRCGGRELKLTARVRGHQMRGTARVGRKLRPFTARRARRTGVLLKGRRSRRALSAVGNVNRLAGHGRDELASVDGRRVARTTIVAYLDDTTTVGQANRLLRSVGGGIVSARKGWSAVIVAVPDPGTPRALRQLVTHLARTRGIRDVTTSAVAETQTLPAGVASPPTSRQQTALDHLLASGVATAWNARGAISTGDQPTVIVADRFGHGRLPSQIDARQLARIDRLPDPDNHGYQVASILFATFGNRGSGAGLATGVFPARGRLLPIETIPFVDLLGISHEIDRTLDSVPFHVVLNTSLGQNGGQIDRYTFPEASEWIRNVRAADDPREQRMLHVTSAGNDGETGGSARTNGLFSASGVRDDIIDSLTEGRVGPLTNTLVVENVDEKSDLSELTCLASTSNTDGNIAAPGIDIYSLGKDGQVMPDGPASRGTSFATPIVAGVADYLWSINPDLTPQQVKSAIVANARPALSLTDCPGSRISAPRLDAYAAVLSVDKPEAPSPVAYPVRTAVLDVDGGGFTESDLTAWSSQVLERFSATTRNWSRYDLNGDGFTGGTNAVLFDLDRRGELLGGPPQHNVHLEVPMIGGFERDFDETKPVTDEDILCYYAYSGLYTGSPAQRDAILGLCGRCQQVTGEISLPDRPPQANSTFDTKQLTFQYSSGTVRLARNCNGKSALNVDDGISVTVKRPDGTTRSFSHDFSATSPTTNCTGAIFDGGPFDITSLFLPGDNTVTVQFRDICGQGGSGSSEVFLTRFREPDN